MTEPEPLATAQDLLDTPEAGRRALSGGIVRIAGFGVGLIASVIGAAAVLRHLGPVDYGRFGLVLGLVTGIQVVTDLGMTNLGVREYAQRTGADRDRFMGVLIGMRLVTTALLLIVAVAVAVASGWDGQMLAGTVLLGLSSSIIALNSTVGIPLAAEIRMGVVTAIDVARQVGTAVAYVLLALAGAGIVPLLGISVPVALAVLLATVLFVRGSASLRPHFDVRAWIELIKPTLTFALATAAGSIYVYGAMVLTGLVTNEYETGLFAAAFRVFVIVSTFPILFVTTAFPILSRAARDDHTRLAYASQLLMLGSALLGGAAAIGLVLGAEPVIDVLGGASRYAGAEPVLRVMGVALAITFVIAVLGFTAMALHRHRAIIAVNLVALAVSATTVIALGSTHGARGAAWGVLLGEVTLCSGYLIALGRGEPRLRLPATRIARGIPALALGLACWFLPGGPVLQTIAGLAVYAVGLLLGGALPDEVTEHLPWNRRAAPPVA